MDDFTRQELQRLREMLQPVLDKHLDSPKDVLDAAIAERMAELRAAGVRWPSRTSPEAFAKLRTMLLAAFD